MNFFYILPSTDLFIPKTATFIFFWKGFQRHFRYMYIILTLQKKLSASNIIFATAKIRENYTYFSCIAHNFFGFDFLFLLRYTFKRLESKGFHCWW